MTFHTRKLDYFSGSPALLSLDSSFRREVDIVGKY